MPNVLLQYQKPFDFSTYNPKTTDFASDLEDFLSNNIFEKLSNNIMLPNNPSQPTSLTIDGKQVDAKGVNELLTKEIINEDVDITNNEIASLLIHQSSRYRNHDTQNWKQVIANAFLLKNGEQLPTPSLLYLYDTDIQNQAKDLLNSDTPDNRYKLKVGLLGNLLNNPVSSRWLFIVTNEQDYNEFRKQLDANVNMYSNDKDVLKYNRDVQNIDLDKDNNFTSWMTGNNNDGGSFNRLINYTLAQFQPSGYTEQLPINLQAMFNPIGFSFINIETLANSDQKSYNQELKQLQNVTNRMVKFKYYKLTKVQNAQTVNSTKDRQTNNYTKNHNNLQSRSRTAGFSRKMPSMNAQIRRIAKIVNKNMSKVQSSNRYQSQFYSFMRPNRRHPKDMNLRGRIHQIKYRPDIHIYLDTSGSISEDQYKAAVTILIKLAKKLNTNLYFTSFSDSISQPFKLMTQNASIKNIYRQIQLIPKVSGGTEFENVWTMIDKIDHQNQIQHNAPRLNFVVTDFCYGIRASYTPQTNHASTKKTFYLPLASTQEEYEEVSEYAENFANQLLDKNDDTICSRIIM